MCQNVENNVNINKGNGEYLEIAIGPVCVEVPLSVGRWETIKIHRSIAYHSD